jgi:hypothetical protein
VRVFESFFQEIDRRWQRTESPQDKIRLRLIGSAALMLQTDYERGTKDSDVLETAQLTEGLQARLLELAGKGTDLHVRHKIYLDIVQGSLPFLPQVPLCHPLSALNQSLQHFEVEVLDIVDVVVSKLKRFNPNDVSDIHAMVDRDLVDHGRLIQRFEAAADAYSMDARASDLPKYVKNLNRVERDSFGVPETPIELPAWI